MKHRPDWEVPERGINLPEECMDLLKARMSNAER